MAKFNMVKISSINAICYLTKTRFDQVQHVGNELNQLHFFRLDTCNCFKQMPINWMTFNLSSDRTNGRRSYVVRLVSDIEIVRAPMAIAPRILKFQR